MREPLNHSLSYFEYADNGSDNPPVRYIGPYSSFTMRGRIEGILPDAPTDMPDTGDETDDEFEDVSRSTPTASDYESDIN